MAIAESNPHSLPEPQPQSARAVSVPCAACGSDSKEEYRRDWYQLDGQEYGLVRCQSCGLAYLSPRPPIAEYRRLLQSEDFFDQGYGDGAYERGYFDRRDDWLDQYDKAVERIEQQVGYVGRLLQWGAGGGFYAEAARRRGWHVQAAEENKMAADYAEIEFPLDIYRGPVSEIPFEPATFDITLSHDSLPFQPNPKEVLQGLFRMTRPGGQLIVNVPAYVNSGMHRAFYGAQKWLPKSWLGKELCASMKLDGKGPRLSKRPYRLHHFHTASLSALLETTGWKIETVEADLPRPDYLFERRNLSLREKTVKWAFACTGGLVRARLLPAAQLQILARRPLR